MFAGDNNNNNFSSRYPAEHQPPYIIAVLCRCVEIRTFEPRMLVQCVELQRPKFITSAGSVGASFVGSGLKLMNSASVNVSRRFSRASALITYLLMSVTLFSKCSLESHLCILSSKGQTLSTLPATTLFGAWFPCRYPARSSSFCRTSSLSWLSSWR